MKELKYAFRRATNGVSKRLVRSARKVVFLFTLYEVLVIVLWATYAGTPAEHASFAILVLLPVFLNPANDAKAAFRTELSGLGLK
jgi:hypothetical protein